MKITFDQHIGIFEDAISKEWCEDVINIFNNNKSKSRIELDNHHPLIIQDTSSNLEDFSQSSSDFFIKTFWNNIYPYYETFYKINTSYSKSLSLLGTKIQKTLPTEGFHV